ncbi:MAG: hypothetical protein O4807_16440 [Trichodesmium sp. St19_bin2]|nr:hypothetical protein [Trichodesmium sp. St19_bin2]
MILSGKFYYQVKELLNVSYIYREYSESVNIQVILSISVDEFSYP